MDMARKFIQMGRTRSLRYALRKGGRKYEQPSSGSESKQERKGKGKDKHQSTDNDNHNDEGDGDEVADEKESNKEPARAGRKEIPRTGEVYDRGKLEGANIFEGYLNRCWEAEGYSKAWEDWREAGKKGSSASASTRTRTKGQT
jgi:hypothetical protein